MEELGEKSTKLRMLAQQLRSYNSSPTQYGSAIVPSAAVLVCIFEGADGDFRVLLTKRSSTLASHAGEVALPGGKREDGDPSFVDTALREAQEIGLNPALVDVVAVTPPFFIKYGMKVVPVIGILYDKEAYCPVLNREEVDSLFDVPLEMFLKNDNRRAERRQWHGENYLLHFFDYHSGSDHQVIWGFTAGVLISVASQAFERHPEFEELKAPFWTSLKL